MGIVPLKICVLVKPYSYSIKLPEIGGEQCYYWDNFDPENRKPVLLHGINHFLNNKLEMETFMKERSESFNWKTAT